MNMKIQVERIPISRDDWRSLIAIFGSEIADQELERAHDPHRRGPIDPSCLPAPADHSSGDEAGAVPILALGPDDGDE